MPNITFVDTPGKLYDLFFLFLLNFNKEQYLSDNPAHQISPEEVSYYTQFLENCPPIPEDLRVFFQMDDTGKSFMTRFYFEKHSALMLHDTYDLAFVRNELSDINQVTENMLLYYFPTLTAADIAACRNSVTAVNRVIKNSDLSGVLKASLYNFFIEPDVVLRMLADELLEKSFVQKLNMSLDCNMYHKLQKEFDFSLLEKSLAHSKKGTADFSGISEVCVTFCAYCKNLVYYSTVENNALFLMLGCKYKDLLVSLQNQEMYPDLKEFGHAISDANRVAILDMIYKRGKVTAKEIEQERGLSAPNAYYHLSLMVKAGVLNSNSIGKTAYYSISSLYFRTLSEVALYYSKGGKVAV